MAKESGKSGKTEVDRAKEEIEKLIRRLLAARKGKEAELKVDEVKVLCLRVREQVIHFLC
jgi:hypothetical protein